MSDIEIKSRWIDRHNSDVVVVTGLLNDLVLFDYCNNENKKSGSRSKSDFVKQFKLLNAAPAPQADMVNHPPHYKDESGIEDLLEAAKKLREFQSKDTDEYKTMKDYSYDLWGAIGDVVYELNKYETKIKS